MLTSFRQSTNRVVGIGLFVGLVAALAVAWWHSGGRDAGQPAPLPALLRVGSQFDVPGHDWTDVQRHVVILIDHECPGCNASLPFYRRLDAKVAVTTDTHLVILSTTDDEDATAWLDQTGVRSRWRLPVSDPGAYGFIGTPTLLILDQTSHVADMAVGRLAAADEESVLDGLFAAGRGQPLSPFRPAREVSAVDFAVAQGLDQAQIVDLRDRSSYRRRHRAGSVNIPLDELEIRAGVELAVSRPTIIDCERQDLTTCRIGGILLANQGFIDVAIIVPR